MIRSILLVASLTLPLHSLFGEGPFGLVRNAGMEELNPGTNVPAGWTANSDQLSLSASDVAYQGNQALRIEVKASRHGWIRSDRFAVTPNTPYRFRAAFLTQTGRSGAKPFYGVRIYFSDSGWHPEDSQPYLIEHEASRDNGQDWVIKGATFETGETTRWGYIGLLLSGSSEGALLLDDVLLERADIQTSE